MIPRPTAENRCAREHITLKVEHLAQWYLRLNGFMTINDFVLHRDHKPWSQRTDAAIFGVRFPFRKELDFEDDEPFRSVGKPHFIIAEITQGECKLNGPWTKPECENMQYVLQALGAFNPKEVDGIGQSLYEKFHFDAPDFRIELIAFGRKASNDLSDPEKLLTQLEFHALCKFIFRRFRQFIHIKKNHQHWDYAGRKLWDLTEENWSSEESFVKQALNAFGLATAPTPNHEDGDFRS
jgi:hypothetical protein